MELRVAITGHVDHGKSTLIGRLLYDTDSLPIGKAEEILASSARRGHDVEWSFAVDAAQEERDQAITIETTRVWLQHAGGRIVIIDTPGHREFIKNMMSGAADADAAVLVIDALEGIKDQTRRHAYLLQLLDVPEIVVAVNKIDALAEPEPRYRELCRDVDELLARARSTARAIVPISARDGDNVARRSARTPWYHGPTILDALLAVRTAPPPLDRTLRFFVQDVYRRAGERIAVGRVERGAVAAGDAIRLFPSGAATRVRGIERWPADGAPARAGESVGLTFDDPVFVDRGDVVARAEDPSVAVSASVDGVFFWLDAAAPAAGETLILRTGTAEVGATIVAVDQRIDLGMFDRDAPPDASPRHAAFALQLRTARPIATESGARSVLQRGVSVVAGGKLTRVASAALGGAPIFAVQGVTTADERTQRNGYRGLVAWLTGPPSSGKSTLAAAAERELVARGYQAFVLDGDDLRHGLNADLGFDRESRRENVRRLGEVAALFARAGTIVLVAAVSPFAADRAAARAAAGDAFVEVAVTAAPATCERRDVKGLYRRARAGELPEFTGVSAPYEAPHDAELVLDTDRLSVEEAAATFVDALVAAAAPRRAPAFASG